MTKIVPNTDGEARTHNLRLRNAAVGKRRATITPRRLVYRSILAFISAAKDLIGARQPVP